MVGQQDIQFTSPLSATTAPVPQSEKHDANGTTQLHQSKPLIVAISGCSSSGKTLLSLLLKAVFSDSGLSISNCANPPQVCQPTVIHEDDYFKPKRACPLVSFETTYSDSSFILKSRHCSDLSLYTFKQYNEASSASVCQDTMTEKQILGTLTGPDTDCWEAINISELAMVCILPHMSPNTYLKPIADFLYALEKLRTGTMQERPPKQHTGLQETMMDMQKWTTCVQDLQEMIKRWLHKRHSLGSSTIHGCGFHESKSEAHKAILQTLCIVEGFLLYNDLNMPDLLDRVVISTDIKALTASGHEENVQTLAQGTGDPLASDGSRDHLRPRAKCPSHPQDALAEFFDMKLFLPTSKNTAKERRFARKTYVDPPSGCRTEGQYWKTEGYFEGVAWPNYQKLHQWLLSDGTNTRGEGYLAQLEPIVKENIYSKTECKHRKKGDIYVREEDAGVEETLHWAIEIILAHIENHACISRGA